MLSSMSLMVARQCQGTAASSMAMSHMTRLACPAASANLFSANKAQSLQQKKIQSLRYQTLAPRNVNGVLSANKINNSTLVPARQMSGDHVRLWSLERAVSVLQIPCFIVPFMWTNPMTDAVFATLLVLHSHWGVEAIVVDYIRPSLFGGNEIIPNICQALVWALSAFTLGSLYYFNYSDIGVVAAIKSLWSM